MGGSTLNCPTGNVAPAPGWTPAWRKVQLNPSSGKLKKALTRYICAPVVPSKSFAQAVTAKPDTGASNHYFAASDALVLTKLSPNPHGPSVTLPDMSTIYAEQQGFLPLPSLSKEAKRTQVFSAITNASLILIGQLRNDGCEAKFAKKSMSVSKDGEKIMEGVRNFNDGLWEISATPQVINHKINAIICKDKLKSELASYLHACACSPPISSFIQAVENGNFATWSGIHDVDFAKFLDPTIANFASQPSLRNWPIKIKDALVIALNSWVLLASLESDGSGKKPCCSA